MSKINSFYPFTALEFWTATLTGSFIASYTTDYGIWWVVLKGLLITVPLLIIIFIVKNKKKFF